MRVFDSPSFIDVKTCCSCLENQTEFNLSARPSLIHNFRWAPLNVKLCNLQHDFFFYAVFAKWSTQHLLTFGLGNIENGAGNKKL